MKILKEREFWFLAAFTIFYFNEPLFGGKTFFFRDLYLFYYPQRLHFIQMIRSGEWPLWDPYLHGGMPFLGEVANLVLYPTTLLYFIFPALTAFNVEIVLHILLAVLATYALGRSLRMSRPAALLAAAVYAFCGYSLSCVNLFIRLLALPFVPLLLLFWHRFMSEQQMRWFVAAVIIMVPFILTGSVENVAMALLFVAIWSVIYPYKPVISRRLVFWLLLCGFSAGLSLIQILPSLETVAQSSRSEGYRYQVFSAWSLNPLRIPEMIFPGFFGYTDKIRAEDYWAIGLEHYAPYILSIYFGLAPLVLAVRALRKDEGDEKIFPKSIRVYLFCFTSLAILLSFGAYLPGFYLIHGLPFFDRFRYPLKFLAGGILPLALLAGTGLQRDFGFNWRPTRRALLTFWLISFLLILFFASFQFSGGFSSRFLQTYFQTSSGVAREGITYSLLHAAGVWLIVTLLYQYRRLSLRCWQQSLFASLLLFDLLWAGLGVNHFAPREFFTDVPNLVTLVRNNISGGRFVRLPNPKNMRYFFPANDVVYWHRWSLETLENYSGAFYNIPLIFHEDYDGLAPRKIHRLFEVTSAASDQQKRTILSASGVSLLLGAQELSIPGWERISVVRTASSAPFYLYHARDFRGRAWFVPHARNAKDANEALNQMLQPDFQPYSEAILEQPEHAANGECDPAEVKELHRSNMEVNYSIQNRCEGYVVFAETFYPGWKSEVDGKASRIIPANYAFSAVFVPPGSHNIRRYYRPASFFWGIIGTIVAATLFFLLIKSKLPGKFLMDHRHRSEIMERRTQEV